MQKSINGLKAGTTYSIQVRSITPNETSEWSPIVDKYIPIPAITPNAPTNVTATGNPDNIKISWTQATLNTDNTSLSQPAYYQVYQSLTSTVDTNGTPVGKTSGASFTYETTFYDVNQYFNVVTVDGFGNKNSTTANVVSAIASVPSVMSALICRLSSYTRSSGTTNTSFTTTTPHGLTLGDKVYIHDAVSDQNTITTISVTGTTAIATTNAAHNFAINDTVLISGSSNDSFNETVIVTAVTTSIPYTFTYQSKASGAYSGTSYAYAKTGLSTANTLFGTAAEVLSTPTDKSFTCNPNTGTSAVNSTSTSYTVSSVTSDGTYVTYTLPSAPGGLVGFKLNVSGCVPNIFNTDDTDISITTIDSIKIKSSSTGSYTANSGTAVVRPPGYMYPTDNAVRIKSDGITIGNMSTGYIVGISPTSFNMQSSGSSTRLSLTSSEIAMYKSGDKTVSLDGSNGNATIVGKFSTGFSPNARVELDSGATIPESINFYAGINGEVPGVIQTQIDGTNSGVLSIKPPRPTTSYISPAITLTSSGTGNPTAKITTSPSNINLEFYSKYALFKTGNFIGTTMLEITPEGLYSEPMAPTVYSYGTGVTIAAAQNTMSRLPDTGSVIAATFTAPSSGRVFIAVSGTIQTNGSTSKLGWFLRTGATGGSGTLITTGDEAAGGTIVHTDSTAANTYLMASSPLYLQTGLTSGSTYNVTFGHVNTDSATKSFSNRKITIIPSL